MKGKNYAWAVIIGKDEDVPCALLTVGYLRRTNTIGSIIAIVPWDITEESRSLVHAAFDWFTVGHLGSEIDTNSRKNLLALQCWKLCGFDRVVALNAGLLALNHVDEIFQTEGLICNDNGNWNGISLKPSNRDYKEIRKLGQNYVSAETASDLLKTFSTIHNGQHNMLQTIGTVSQYPNQVDKLKNKGNFQFLQVNQGIVHQILNDNDHGDEELKQIYNTFVKPMLEHKEDITDMPSPSTNQDTSGWIAIVGMSCRFPGANNLAEYWDLLISGKNTASTFPASRAFSKDNVDTNIKANFLKCDASEFDASFFGVSPTEATFTDPQTRLLLEVSWEALEDASINPEKLRGTNTGVFYGSWKQEYRDLLNEQTPAVDEFLRKYLGNGFGATAAKLSYFYGLNGPNLATENGCSSSLVAVDLACKSLLNEECPIAIASSANLIMQLNDKVQVWCTDGLCKSFDASAKGYARSEGVAVLVLKRYSDAVQAGDRIHSIIRGCGLSQEGLSKSFGTPTIESETDSMKRALQNSGVVPNQVDYIEAHATGTSVGDPIEATAINQAYGGERNCPLVIASGKTNIGHTEATSGLAGMLKTILSMKHEMIPPHINLNTVNPKLNFEPVQGEIPFEAKPWPKSATRPRIAGISSFGITGTDAHVIIQEPPEPITSGARSTFGTWPVNILTASAKTEQGLSQLSANFADHLETCSDNMFDACFTANSGRAHHAHRAAWVGTKPTDFIQQIRNNDGISGKTKSPKVCFTFPGIMGKMNFGPIKSLYQANPVFKTSMDICDTIIKQITGTSVVSILHSKDFILTPATAAKYPHGVYEALTIASQYSLTNMWESWGIKPDAAVGHCSGELSAGVCAGTLEIADALKIVICWATKATEADPGVMLAISSDKETVSNLIAEFQTNNGDVNGNDAGIWFDIACANSMGQTTVACSQLVAKQFQAYCITRDFLCKMIPLNLAIHSRALDPIVPHFKAVCEQAAKHPLKRTYISSVTGREMSNEEITSDHWAMCIRKPVEFITCCKSVVDMGFDVCVEIGLNDLLSKLTLTNVDSFQADVECLHSINVTVPTKNPLSIPLTTLAKLYVMGCDVDWEGFYRYLPKNKVSLPHYPFQRKSFWVDVKKKKESQLNMSSLHPLLGAPIANATGKDIFQSNISNDSVSYIYDHCIGPEVIYPAAAHLELMLSSGCVALDDNKSDTDKGIRRPPYPIKVENFTVHQPLHLQNQLSKKLQTILERNDDQGTYNITVYSEHPKIKSQWTAFASGTYRNALADETIKDSMFNMSNAFNLNDIMNRCSADQEIVSTFYSQLAQVGLMFGPTFTSLKTIHFNDNETLAMIQAPVSKEDYICHPIISDALLQIFIFHTIRQIKKLHVPVKISKYIHFPRANELQANSQLFVYCCAEESGLTTKVYLLDSEGAILGLMMYPELIGTSTQSVLEASGCLSNVKKYPVIYEQYWKGVNSLASVDNVNNSGNSKWIVLHDGLNSQDYSEIAHKLKSISRECVSVPLEQLEQAMSQGQLQDHINDIFSGVKDDLEGMLCLVNGADQDDLNEEKICQKYVEPLLCYSKFLLRTKFKVMPKLIIVTSGAWYIGEENNVESLHPISSTIWGYLRTMRAEMPGIFSKSIDLDPDVDFTNGLCDLLLNEMFNDGDKENEILYRGGSRYLRRLRKDQQITRTIQFPDSRYYTVELPATKILADLKYIPREPLPLGGDDVEIEIRTASLNFKDVLNIMKPTKEFEAIKTIGLDYSGVITSVGGNVKKWKVGDAVFGCSFDQGTIASHLVSNASLVARVPPKMTFSEAATLPAVFLTAWYCMVDIANMKSGQTILIHAASGGVGLIAIQIAKLLGINIIGTAGNARKRNFVKSLGVEHVFSSRNLEYGQKIKDLTNGKGVDMVLNCLTGPGFKETSLEICREGGHFTEISKVDIWQLEQVKERKPSVHYNIVYMPDVEMPAIASLLIKLSQLLADKYITTLPFARYDASNIVDALTFLQKAKQIGKVVVEMPLYNLKPDSQICSWDERMFNTSSTYLITGGFGEIGLSVAKWMVSQGAKYLVLISRRQPTKEVTDMVNYLESIGAVVVVKQVDIADFTQCKNLLDAIKISNLPPLRGIHHCAGVISDCMISKQDWSSFEKVYAPKVSGAVNLHRLTLNYSLEFFVLYSSLTSTFGNIGQANYTSANAYMDSLAEFRHAKALKILSINWGQWDGGMAKGMELYSAIPFSIDEGINALEKLMRQNKVAAMAADVNFKNLVIQSPYLKDNLLADMEIIGEKSHGESSSKSGQLNENRGGKSLQEMYLEAEESDRPNVIQDAVISMASQALGLEKDEIELETNFSDMGMDSLMSIEFTNNLQSVMGNVVLGFIDMDEYGSVLKLSELILEHLK